MRSPWQHKIKLGLGRIKNLLTAFAGFFRFWYKKAEKCQWGRIFFFWPNMAVFSVIDWGRVNCELPVG
jgi:hypothetical protein